MNCRCTQFVCAEVGRASLEAIRDAGQLDASINGRRSLAKTKVDDGWIVELRWPGEIRRSRIPEDTEVERLAVRFLPRRLCVLSERGEAANLTR